MSECPHKQLKKQMVGEPFWYVCECGQKFRVEPWDGKVSVLAAPDPRKDLALDDVAADIVHQILRFDDKCNGAHIVNLQTGAVTTPETRMIEWVTERLAEMRGAKR